MLLRTVWIALTLLGCFAFTAPFVQGGEQRVDVLVYGGTPGGVAAAVAAARGGLKVALIEQTTRVGGLNTSGINTAETEHMLEWTIGGIAQEYFERLGKRMGMKGPAYKFLSGKALEEFNALLKEAQVDVRHGLRLSAVQKTGTTLERITLSDGSVWAAAVFIDATYEGDLMARAGVSYTFGREARATYGEEAAGIRLDKTIQTASPYDADGRLLPGISAEAKDLKEGDAHPGVMNYNFRLCFTKNPANRVPVPAPDTYDPARYTLLKRFCENAAAQKKALKLGDFIDLYGRAEGKFEVNNKQAAVISIGHFGGQFAWPDANDEQRAAIYDDHKQYTLGLLHFLATDASVPENVRTELQAWGLAKDEFTENGNWPPYLYVREARRMKGRAVVTQQDVQTQTTKDDSIGMGSHFIDCHHVQRVALSPTTFCNEGRIWRIGYAYQIPYRALTPQAAECGNLLVPVAASFSHVAFCTYRVEATWMVGGHAAGAAAVQCVKRGVTVQNVDVPALQAVLREQKQVIDFIPGQPTKRPGGTNGPPEF